MKKNGFTLIELLAVIVILAIIALIAVPIVLHIIEDSKKSSQKESINMYGKAVEDAVANYLLINPNDKDITVAKIEKYINYSSGEKVECEINIYKSGKIYLDKCTVGGTEVTYTYGEKEKTLCTLTEDTGETGLSIGDKYTCEVIKGMEEPFTFYVLTDPVNGKVNLIMNSNICADGTIPTSTNTCLYAWHAGVDNNNYGPDTAMTNLYNATKNWNNIPDMDLSGTNAYEDENNKTDSRKGYTGITTNNGVATITGKNGATSTTIGTTELPLKSRLPREDEVTSQEAGCEKSIAETCSAWLVENLADAEYSKYSTVPKTEDIYGYWLLSSHPGTSLLARLVYYSGGMTSNRTSYASGYGLRPVITVSMSDLS